MKISGTIERRDGAFSLIEVMIALGIFFMAVFAILALVAGTLKNARLLQRPQIDAGMAAATYVNTNRFFEGTISGDFEDFLRDYSYEIETYSGGTNGLVAADIVLHRRGAQQPVDRLSILVYDPNFKPGTGIGGGLGR